MHKLWKICEQAVVKVGYIFTRQTWKNSFSANPCVKPTSFALFLNNQIYILSTAKNEVLTTVINLLFHLFHSPYYYDYERIY